MSKGIHICELYIATAIDFDAIILHRIILPPLGTPETFPRLFCSTMAYPDQLHMYRHEPIWSARTTYRTDNVELSDSGL